MAGASRRTFICQRGLSWGANGEHAYEPGDVIRDLPTDCVGWMLAEGTVREATPEDLGEFAPEED